MIRRDDQVKPIIKPYSDYPDWKVGWVYPDGKLLIIRGEHRWVAIVDNHEVKKV